ncbi:RHS repeat domain-containing protein [Butyrivibrio sp. M55]|uniref:RHS repeat domain-containing protein n=1 Tax=Butyrivibrio sp. M55 TaxID=1855323 RepID=UPI0015878182|nr:RHS repeat-associated core domain-containing protein [Butyrivibrio sp. M55]
MTSTDKQGELDKYFYSYKNAGLISGIDRNRRGLDKVSGRYEYSYDAIGRLTKTTHDGITKAAYEYDAFGNRTSMSETETKTSYTYDVLDRLVEAKELNNSQAILKTYDYDKRGNQTKEFIDGLLQKTFTFDATNMLSKVVDKDKGELENHYNGLGFRVASTRPEEKIEYLCDLSKDYYNLLERTVNGETESFVYDNNVISMSKSGNNFYYLQDELGSPMYMTGTDGMAVSSYAFDDFGRNIDPFTGKQKKHGYTKQGNIIQPFAFTGYQEDEVSGLKFAQARYYSAEKGRFVGEDQIKGFMDSADTQHRYIYCLNNPQNLIDENGKEPAIINSTPTLSNQSDVGFYPMPESDVGFYPATKSNSLSSDDSTMQCEGENSSAGITITSQDVSTGSKFIQNGIEVLKIGLLTGAKVLSRRSKQISAMLHSAKIARPGHALSYYRSNNAVRRSMREAAAKNLSNAEKATNIAKKIDDFGKYIDVAAVALDVGVGVYDNIQKKQPIDRILSDATVDAVVSTLQIVATTAITTAIVGSGFGIVALGVGLAVSTVVTGLSDDLKIYKGKSLRDLTKDAMYYSIKHWKPALL